MVMDWKLELIVVPAADLDRAKLSDVDPDTDQFRPLRRSQLAQPHHYRGGPR
jgi:hypothetical protein